MQFQYPLHYITSLALKYDRRQNISDDNRQVKHKHEEWNLHYEKKPGVERNSWMHLFPTTMFNQIVTYLTCRIFWNWIQELKTEERIFRYIQDLVELQIISAYRK